MRRTLEITLFEEAIIACQCTEPYRKQTEPADFAVFEQWVTTYVTNWATCDARNHTVGDFIMKYPDYIQQLKKWATSSNRWTKRAAAVTLIIPARRRIISEQMAEIGRYYYCWTAMTWYRKATVGC